MCRLLLTKAVLQHQRDVRVKRMAELNQELHRVNMTALKADNKTTRALDAVRRETELVLVQLRSTETDLQREQRTNEQSQVSKFKSLTREVERPLRSNQPNATRWWCQFEQHTGRY